MRGVIRAFTTAVAPVAKAGPITVPTARSTTLPRSRKDRKPVILVTSSVLVEWPGWRREPGRKDSSRSPKHSGFEAASALLGASLLLAPPGLVAFSWRLTVLGQLSVFGLAFARSLGVGHVAARRRICLL